MDCLDVENGAVVDVAYAIYNRYSSVYLHRMYVPAFRHALSTTLHCGCREIPSRQVGQVKTKNTKKDQALG